VAPVLSRATRDAIRRLLLRRGDGAERRGLFDAEQLEGILGALDGLAHWLRERRRGVERAAQASAGAHRFSERDALCIAYVDHVSGSEGSAAGRLQRLFNGHLAGLYSHLHVLPHFPCPRLVPALPGPAGRADGGFEPMSFEMDPRYGEPAELRAVDAALMFDFVLNHLSVESAWFRGFLAGDEAYTDFFVTLTDEQLARLDLAGVFRPRAHHPVVDFEAADGHIEHVWCTFSATQADLDIKSPAVFVAVAEALVKNFIGEGASWIRLDAVGYLVKMLGLAPDEPKGSCFGEPETHAVIKAMRCFVGEVAPEVKLVAEVNATAEVIAEYYGAAGDEAHLVYEFPVAPLSLFTMHAGDAAAMMAWAARRLERPERMGLAFTASHDGVGVLPMHDVPPLADGTPALDFLLRELEARGAGINHKSQVVDDRSHEVPYEACISWPQAITSPGELAALRRDELDGERLACLARRIVASQSFAWSAPHCVPADYLGAIAVLFDDEATATATGHHRNRNRGLIDAAAFESALTSPRTGHERLVRAVFQAKRRMLAARRSHDAFSPHAVCEVDVVTVAAARDASRPVYSVMRRSPSGGADVLALTNCSGKPQIVRLSDGLVGGAARLDDLLSDARYACDGPLTVTLAPHRVAWLAAQGS
jgi:sucrose phosphorylase